MFDINLLRNDIAATAERMKARNYVIDTAAFEALEAERKALQIQTQELQQQRNTLSKASVRPRPRRTKRRRSSCSQRLPPCLKRSRQTSWRWRACRSA